MVKLHKSVLPEGTGIYSREDWRPGAAVRDILNADCHGKCYICEDKPKNANDLTVEHVRPKHTNPALEYAWENLLLACSHCNAVKGSDYGDIINPADENGLDPEDVIRFSFGTVTQIDITGNSNEKSVTETVRLLNAAFNAEGVSGSQKLGCKALRNKLYIEMTTFNLYIDHADEPGYDVIIKESLNRAAPFSAFKRKIIRDDAELAAIFETTLT